MTLLPMSFPTTMRRFSVLTALMSALVHSPSVARCQSSTDNDGIRVGISVGGVSTVGLLLEYFDGNRSIDLTVGTWSFHDLSLSLVAKRYFGDNAVRPFVGAGLWVVTANPSDGRLGLAAVLRAPVGVDWNAAGGHSLGASINVNRALWVRRTDPEDDLPLNRRWVPLPGIYYRFEPR